MVKRIALVGLAFLAIGCIGRAKAGTEMVIDNSAQAPVYNYAPPPPPPVYYVPPPPPIVIYPAAGYYRPVRVFGYHRAYLHRRYHGRYWR